MHLATLEGMSACSPPRATALLTESNERSYDFSADIAFDHSIGRLSVWARRREEGIKRMEVALPNRYQGLL